MLGSILASLAFAGAAHAQFYYRYFDQQRPLRLDRGRVAVLGNDRVAAVPRALWQRHGIAEEQVVPSPVAGWFTVATPAGARTAPAAEQLVRDLAAAGGIEFASPVFAGEDGGFVIVTPDILVGFRDGVEPARALAVLSRWGGGTVTDHDWGGMRGAYRVRSGARTGFEVLDAANLLAGRPEVEFAEPDVIFTGRGGHIPNDPGFVSCWGIHNTGQSGGTVDMDMDGPEAWDLTTGDAAVIVAILDTGVQQDHPDINQIAGADLTGQGGGGGPVNACDVHGTAVAGCVSAAIDNNLGTVGIAPSCRSASARTFISSAACNGSWTSASSWTVNALSWAESAGARVTNNSNIYGFTSAAIATKYAQTRQAGMVHFAAAGNGSAGSLAYPASLPSVNAVAALHRSGSRAGFSNYGPGLAFSAPGQSIWTTDRTGGAGYAGGDYVFVDGTSFASPYAAGVAALCLSVNFWLDAATVEQILQDTSVDLGAAGYDPGYGWGFVNAHRAVLAALAAGTTARVSVDSSGAQGNASSSGNSLSAGGRFVAFASSANNLVPGDTNGRDDVFVHDRQTGATERVSVDSAAAQGDGHSVSAAISADGRWVAFRSLATNLVPGDTNGVLDIFVHDRQGGATTRVSVSSSGVEANERSYRPFISSDGRYVVFESLASNLVSGDTNGARDVFVHDRQIGATWRASVGSAGLQSNHNSTMGCISEDGRHVAFASYASNLVAGDTNGVDDVFVHDRASGTTTRVSVSSSGAQADYTTWLPSMSTDGRWVAFQSLATNLVAGDTNGMEDIFVHDCASGATARVSVGEAGAQATGQSFTTSISSDGRYVAFVSYAANLVPGDTNGAPDVFVRDRYRDATRRVSVSSAGLQANGQSPYLPAISGDGRSVAFTSQASNLVSGDTNGSLDVFVQESNRASWSNYGLGWPGANGVPGLWASADPVLCTSIMLLVESSTGAATQAALLVGAVRAAIPTPWEGTLSLQPAFSAPLSLAPGTNAVPVPVPCGAGFLGFPTYFQVLILDGAATQGVAFTRGLALVPGG